MDNLKIYILEKLHISKEKNNIKNNIYKFTKELSVELPFTLKVDGKKPFYVTIEKIEKNHSRWDLYEYDHDEPIFNITESAAKCLFNYNIHKAIVKILYFQDMVNDPDYVMIHYEKE